MATVSAKRAGSRAVARPMSWADICNVEPLTIDDAEAVGIPTAMATIDAETLDALGWGEAWTIAEGGAQ
jgi:hypothetical protein